MHEYVCDLKTLTQPPLARILCVVAIDIDY